MWQADLLGTEASLRVTLKNGDEDVRHEERGNVTRGLFMMAMAQGLESELGPGDDE